MHICRNATNSGRMNATFRLCISTEPTALVIISHLRTGSTYRNLHSHNFLLWGKVEGEIMIPVLLGDKPRVHLFEALPTEPYCLPAAGATRPVLTVPGTLLCHWSFLPAHRVLQNLARRLLLLGFPSLAFLYSFFLFFFFRKGQRLLLSPQQ